jgi:hypothetical protein
MAVLLVQKVATAVPLELSIEQEGVGGVIGKAPTVSLREGDTGNSYLDWADNTFKTVGWTIKFQSMTDIGVGVYQRLLNLSLVTSVLAGDFLIAEYAVNDGGDVIGNDLDTLIVNDTTTDLSLLRKSVTNRLEDYPGSPGHLILFDDDGTTPLKNWEIRDASGGAVIATVGSPAKRSASII